MIFREPLKNLAGTFYDELAMPSYNTIRWQSRTINFAMSPNNELSVSVRRCHRCFFGG
jgi:hypothetical protein